MISSKDFERVFYHYVRKNPKYFKSVNKSFFTSKELNVLMHITKAFYERFSEIPTKENLKVIAKQKYEDLLTDNIVDTIFNEDISKFDEKYLQETSESWILWKNLDKSLLDTIEYVKTADVTPDNVTEIVNKVKDMINSRNSVSFDNNLGLDFFNPESHIQKIESLLSTNHEFVDNFCGGYLKKSLVVYAGEQNIGKCTHKSTLIKVKNKKTNYVETMPIEDFFNLIKKCS